MTFGLRAPNLSLAMRFLFLRLLVLLSNSLGIGRQVKTLSRCGLAAMVRSTAAGELVIQPLRFARTLLRTTKNMLAASRRRESSL